MNRITLTLALMILVLALLIITPTTVAAARYLSYAFEGGDWLNDWLTHVPEAAQDLLLPLGKLAAALSSR